MAGTPPSKILETIATVARMQAQLDGLTATRLNNAAAFLCGRNVTWLGCPAPPIQVAPTLVPHGAATRS